VVRGSTQLRTEMSTRNLRGGVNSARCVRLTTSPRKCGSLDLPRPVRGIGLCFVFFPPLPFRAIFLDNLILLALITKYLVESKKRRSSSTCSFFSLHLWGRSAKLCEQKLKQRISVSYFTWGRVDTWTAETRNFPKKKTILGRSTVFLLLPYISLTGGGITQYSDRLDCLGIGVRFPAWVREFSLLCNVQTDPDAHPDSFIMDNRDSYTWDKEAGACSWLLISVKCREEWWRYIFTPHTSSWHRA
jgi:hypothetical protein